MLEFGDKLKKRNFLKKVFKIPARDVLKMEPKNMIADDIKITINFHQTTPDGACIHKKCTVTNYKNKKEMFGRGQTEVSGESRDHSTLLGVLQHHVCNIFVK